MPDFPTLSDWQPTRTTLHAHVRVLGELCKLLNEPHPLWWHASLEVTAEGITTGPMALEQDTVEVLLVPESLQVVIRLGGRKERSIQLESGLPAAALAVKIAESLSLDEHSAEGDRLVVEDTTSREIDGEAARRFHRVLERVQKVFEGTRAEICGDCSPIQLWPHHFDLSFERFGFPLPSADTDSASDQGRCQIGFGFSPGDDGHPEPYFYANPWPFDPSLTEAPLPAGARWHLEGWEGSLLPYSAVHTAGEDLLRNYLVTVYRAAAPLLGD